MVAIVKCLILEYMVKINEQGSVRVDLLGGTIDLVPINFILRETLTLNLATSLKAKVQVEQIEDSIVEIVSLDYDSVNRFEEKDFTAQNFDGDFFGPLSFVCQILAHFKLTKNIRLTLESGSPPGAGLGGSSSMGVTIYKALSHFTDSSFHRLDAIKTIQSIESRILNKGPCGYQDYYPALYGGVLALHPKNGEVEVEQLYNEDFKNFLEKRVTLIYSGSLRLSAINNWEVYKDFFDNKNGVREGLAKISSLSRQAYEMIKAGDFEKFLNLLEQEGEAREKLFANIVTEEMRIFFEKLKEDKIATGMKVCGAGGGGCFIITHKVGDHDKIKKMASQYDMRVLDFNICEPL